MITVGGVDTYYDYDEHQWKFRRLGGGPIHKEVVEALEPAGQSVSDSQEHPPARTGKKANLVKLADD